MKRWYANLPVMHKILLGLSAVSPLFLSMIILDICLSMQQQNILGQVAHTANIHQIAISLSHVETLSRYILTCNLLLGGATAVAGCGYSFLLSSVITRPLRQVKTVARLTAHVWLMELADGLIALAQGDWSISVQQHPLPDFYSTQDEIGQIRQCLQITMKTLHHMSAIYETTRQELQGLYTCIQKQNEILTAANDHLNSLATTDPLTGLPNHRAIMGRIDEEIVRCQSTQQNCGIIFVDVDRFKRINDTWGHGAGDAVLRFVGQQLRASLRAEDYIGRYGGEEFAILLTDVEQHEGFEIAERLRDTIAALPCMCEVAEGQQIPIPVTASFGLAVYPLDGITRKDLIEQADAAMYIAKHSGRNRVCLPDDEVIQVTPPIEQAEALTSV